MSLPAQLAQLSQLHQENVLTDDEFSQAKAAIIQDFTLAAHRQVPQPAWQPPPKGQPPPPRYGLPSDLTSAAERGNLAEVQELLQAGGDINASHGWVNFHGSTKVPKSTPPPEQPKRRRRCPPTPAPARLYVASPLSRASRCRLRLPCRHDASPALSPHHHPTHPLAHLLTRRSRARAAPPHAYRAGGMGASALRSCPRTPGRGQGARQRWRRCEQGGSNRRHTIGFGVAPEIWTSRWTSCAGV